MMIEIIFVYTRLKVISARKFLVIMPSKKMMAATKRALYKKRLCCV